MTSYPNPHMFKRCTENRSSGKFWADVKDVFPHISSVAVKKLLPFPPTYLWKTSVLKTLTIITKYQNKPNTNTMTLHLSKIAPDLNSCLANKEAHTLYYVIAIY